MFEDDGEFEKFYERNLHNLFTSGSEEKPSRGILQSFHKTRFRRVMKFIHGQPVSTVKDSLTYSIDVQKYILNYLQNELSKKRKNPEVTKEKGKKEAKEG